MFYYDLKDSTSVSLGLASQESREIDHRIVGGNYKEDSLIEDEGKTSQRFGVSKSVIREGIKVLVAKGILEVKRGSGTRVRRRASWALLDNDVLAWHLSVEPKPAFLLQLMDMRRMIETKAAAWAAMHGTNAKIEAIEAAQMRMEKGEHSIEEFVLADATFHRAILSAANNEILLSAKGVIFSALLNSVRLTNADPRENARSVPLHRSVVSAIKVKDHALAEKEMTAHLIDKAARLECAISGLSKQ